MCEVRNLYRTENFLRDYGRAEGDDVTMGDAGSGLKDLLKFDPFSVMVPAAEPRWREKQKVLAVHVEEGIDRDEKVTTHPIILLAVFPACDPCIANLPVTEMNGRALTNSTRSSPRSSS